MSARVVVEYAGWSDHPERDGLIADAAFLCGLGDQISHGYSVDLGVRDLSYLALSETVARSAIECMRPRLPWAEFSIAREG